MPRQPVKPQNRQRVVRACDSCKASKKRCNGSHPCIACEKRGLARSCVYSQGHRHHPLPQSNSSPSSRRNIQDNSSIASERDIPQAVLASPNSWNIGNASAISIESLTTTDVDAFREAGSESRGSSNDSMGQPPVMLSSENGEKVFIGSSAAISFLCFLQKTLKRNAGPSGFTDAQESHELFEADTPGMDSTYYYDELSIEEKWAFMQSFFDASSGLLDLYSWSDLSRMLETNTSNDHITDQSSAKGSSLEMASLYLIVAIGAQCQGPTREAITWTVELFSYARKIALGGMLENPSLDLIRVFMLMAFYMFGACRRNSAFMYLGVACRAADILGLHMSAQYKHLSADARNARLRTAKSLRVFDVVCNSILGRPTITPPIPPDATSYLNSQNAVDSDIQYKALALGASYEIAAVLDSAVVKSAAGELDTDEAEALLLALQERTRSFPSILRRSSGGKFPLSRHVTIGNVHVSSVYYFSVIIVTRQFLIQHVIPQLSKKSRSHSGSHSTPENVTTSDSKIVHLADACIEAAIFMAQMCYEVMKSGQLAGNMCIIKAWMFASGLVLGFSLLVENSSTKDGRREAFLKALHVLGELKRLSPQAEQYHNILLSFHQAIKAYQEQFRQANGKAKAKLVDQIFLPNMATGLEVSEAIATHLPSPEWSAMEGAPMGWESQLAVNSSENIIAIDPPFIGENDLIVQMFWDLDSYAMANSDRVPPHISMNLGDPI